MVPLLAANLIHFLNGLLLAAGTIFGMQPDSPASKQVSHCPERFPFFIAHKKTSPPAQRGYFHTFSITLPSLPVCKSRSAA